MIYKIVVWGIGNEYERIINQLKFEEFKGNIVIKALVSKPFNYVENMYDGIPIIPASDLINIDFDYIIVASYIYFKEIFNEAISLEIKEDKIINGMVFHNPLFDFKRYASLLENKITIISDDCWGGFIYHNLYLKFFSPFVNTFIERDQYIRLISDIKYYLKQPLKKERDVNIRKNLFAIGSLGEGEKKVYLELAHSVSFEKGKLDWDRRVKRVNINNLFIKMGLDAADERCQEYLEVFNNIREKKLCFYSGMQNYKDVLYLKRFEIFVKSGKNMNTIKYHDYIRKLPWLLKSIDLLKLLTGEDDFLRETNNR